MLLEGVKESNGILCKKYGTALGELGAIDPDQLQIIAKAPIHEEYSEVQLGILLINKYLVTAYRKAATGLLIIALSNVFEEQHKIVLRTLYRRY